MSGERLLASYIVRVTVREGERRIHVLDVGSGNTARLSSYSDLVRYMALGEVEGPPDEPPTGRPRRFR